MCFNVFVSWSGVFSLLGLIIEILSFMADFGDQISILLDHVLNVGAIDFGVMG